VLYIAQVVKANRFARKTLPSLRVFALRGRAIYRRRAAAADALFIGGQSGRGAAFGGHGAEIN
jgi:uncharacterized membrane protein YfbV (UPF0208 family)